MQDKLNIQEKRLFGALIEVFGSTETLDQDHLKVLIGALNLRLGREYIRLREFGLIAEIEVQPSFLNRLLGAQPKRLVALTASGREFAREKGLGTVASKHRDVELGGPAVEPVVPVQIARKATVASVRLVKPRKLPNKAASVSSGGNSDQPVKLSKPKLHARDEVSGVGKDLSFKISQQNHAEGLSELLCLQGFHLTEAGRLLAEDRRSKQHTDSQVALEIIVVSVAHALMQQSPFRKLDSFAMIELVDAVNGIFDRFVQDGQLQRDELQASINIMRSLVVGSGNWQITTDELFQDSLRRVATPATFPEHVWVIE